MAMDDLRELKARNAELQRQLVEAQAGAGEKGAAAPAAESGNWETQKRRMLAELESDDRHDAESTERRLKIEEIVARTDKIIAEKDREIEELRHLLNNQSNSLGSLAMGAAALEQVFDQDAIIREERRGCNSCRASARTSYGRPKSRLPWSGRGWPAATPRSKRRSAMPTRAASSAEADADALAPTGRPVRGRWRTQLGLTDDGPPEPDRKGTRR